MSPRGATGALGEVGKVQRHISSAEMESARARYRLGQTFKGAVFGILGLICLVLIAPLIGDRLFGAWGQEGECRVIRVIDGDTYRLKCDILGRKTAALIGADTPSTHAVGCREEWIGGMWAKWAARRRLWIGGPVTMQLSFGDFDRMSVAIAVDGVDLAQSLLQAGHGRPGDGWSEAPHWCTTQIAG